MTENVLVPCPACRRHVSTFETACPFCGVRIASNERRERTRAPRLSRAAFMFGIAAATAPAGCGAEPGQGEDPSDAGVAGAGGAAGEDAGDSSGGGPPDDGTAVPHYGAPGCDVAPSEQAHDAVWIAAAVMLGAAARRRRGR
jgi:MYXO-CTERM domain-containing protein